MARHRAALTLLLIGLFLAPPFALFISSVQAAGPQVFAYWHEPKYPRDLQPVAINASVSDPDGVSGVDVIWCYFPPGLCSPPTPMSDDDGDGVWGYLIGTFVAGTKVYYNVTAYDFAGDTTGTPELWLAVVASIEVVPEEANLVAHPDEAILVTGAARYDGNSTLPVEFSEATLVVQETSDVWTANTDSSGNYAISITAPSSDGPFHLTTYVNNTTQAGGEDATLSGMENLTLMVTSIPLPDLEIQNVSRPVSLLEGQQVTFSVRVTNMGNNMSGPTLVSLTDQATPSTGTTKILPSLNASETREVAFEWTCIPGFHTFEVRVDPEDVVVELDESNNAVIFDLQVDADTDGDGIPNVDDTDDDGDGLPDTWEKQYGLDPLADDSSLDSDGDGLSNMKEFEAGTDPTAKDSDGDGYLDSTEIDVGTDPTSGIDNPGNGPWVIGIIVLVLTVLATDVAVLVWFRRERR